MARPGGVDRGVRERPKESGKWWAEYAGADGKMHLEFGGSKSAARKLYELRKTRSGRGAGFPTRAAALRCSTIGLRTTASGRNERVGRSSRAKVATRDCSTRSVAGGPTRLRSPTWSASSRSSASGLAWELSTAILRCFVLSSTAPSATTVSRRRR